MRRYYLVPEWTNCATLCVLAESPEEAVLKFQEYDPSLKGIGMTAHAVIEVPDHVTIIDFEKERP